MNLFINKIPYIEARRIAIEEIQRQGWEEYFLPEGWLNDVLANDAKQRRQFGHSDQYTLLRNIGMWHYCFTVTWNLMSTIPPKFVIHRRTGKVLRVVCPRSLPR